MDPTVYLVIVVICVVLSAFFSSSETALLRLSKEQIDKDLEKHNQLSLIAAKELIKTPARLLVTILLGNNVVNILGAACASSLGVYYLGEKEGLLVSTVSMTAVILIFSEILPKSIAAKNPARVGYFFALPMYIVHKISFPAHFFYTHVLEPLVKKISKADTLKDDTNISAAESIMRLASEINVNKNEGTPLPIIGQAVKAAELTCEDIMTPKSELFSLTPSMSPKQAELELANSRYTRALVFEEDGTKIKGFVHLKDLVRLNNGQAKDTTIESLIKPSLMVPGKLAILNLLPKMQKAFIHIAIVTDAYGNAEGIVTQEDILEEIVGEIRDEFDREELKRIRKKSPGRYEVFGNLSIHDLNRETGWEVTGEKSDTVYEVIYNELGKLPHSGDEVTVGNFNFKVKDTSGRRITRVEITKED